MKFGSSAKATLFAFFGDLPSVVVSVAADAKFDLDACLSSPALL